MAGSIDEEIVRMKFDSSAFERGVGTVLGLLTRLKNSLTFNGGAKGLHDIETAANNTKLSGLSSGIDGVSKKFLALATVGITALTNITNRAVNAGLTFAKSFSFGPIIDGLHEYQTNLQSIQTIQANTDQPLPKINAALDQLNHYSDLTIYNFSEMAKNIGTFTAAGVDLDTATASIKGIANVAALSGSSSQQASSAMYQLSQAIAAGKVGAQDWNSVVTAGMAGKKLQNALAQTGVAMGVLNKSMITGTKSGEALKISGQSFKNSIMSAGGKESWLNSKILVATLASLDGRFSTTALKAELTATGVRKYTDAQIKAHIATARTTLEQKNGVKYTDEQFASLQKMSDSAFLAATQVKTLGQVFDVAKESIGSGWSASFKSIFGNFDEAKTTFTALSGSINGFINKNALARNTLLTNWHDMGGRTVLIQGIKNAFSALGSVLKPLGAAFREIFPRKTAQDLYDMTMRFSRFMASLKASPATMAKLKSVFAGVFAVFDIGKQIVMGIFHVFGMLFGTLTKSSGGVLTFAAHIGDMIVAFDKALKSGDQLQNFFKIVANVLSIPIRLFGLLTAAVSSFFSHFSFGSATGSVSKFGSTSSSVLSRVAGMTGHFGDVIDGLKSKIGPAMDRIAQAFQGVGTAIGKAFTGDNADQILKVLQTGLLASIALTLKNFFKGGFGLSVETGSGGIFGRIKETLEGVTGSLKAMTLELKAKALLEIAIAIGILAVSLALLASIDPKKLQVGLKAMAGAFAELLIAMGLLTKISGSAGFIKLPLIAASLILLAGAILLLSIAVAALSQLSWQELEKGLGAVAILLLALSLASIPLSANSAGLIRAGVSIGLIAIALNLLYIAVKAFSTLGYGEMLKGLGAVIGVLLALTLAMRALPERSMLRNALAILVLSAAMNALYFAVKSFASLSYGALAKGLLAITIALRGIGYAMDSMPRGMIAQALALTILAGALILIDKAVATMGALGFGTIAKGLIGIAGALAIIAVALNAMEGTLPGALALIVAAKGIGILVGSLTALARLSIAQIITSLVTLVATLAIVGGAAVLMAPIIPALLALGVALGLVGIAMLAFGAGAALLGVGLTAIAGAGGAAIAVLLSGINGLIKLLPTLVTALATALVSFLTIIGKNAPAIIAAFAKILVALLEAIPKIIPSLVIAINALVAAILSVLVTNAPKIIAAGIAILLDLLRGIRDNIGEVVKTVAQIIVKFLDALASQLGQIIAAGVNLLFKFLEGVASAAGKIPAEAVKLVFIFLGALFSSFPQIVSAGAKMVGKLVGGIGGALGKVASAGASLVGRMLGGISGRFGDLVSSGGRILGKIVAGVRSGISTAASTVGDAAGSIGRSIINGIIGGISSLAGNIASKLKSAVSGAISSVGDYLGIGGPSKKMRDEIGVHIPEGVVVGIDSGRKSVVNAVHAMGDDALNTMKKTMSNLGSVISDAGIDYNPTITPVLDLSDVRKGAGNLNGILSKTPVSAQVSLDSASAIVLQQQAQIAAAADNASADAPVAPVEITYNQTNNSPKALPAIEIFRKTRSQLAQVEEALNR